MARGFGAALGNPLAVERSDLLSLLDSPEWSVRCSILEQMLEWPPYEPAFPALRQTWLHDPESQVRMRCAWVLGAWHPPDLGQLLRLGLERESCPEVVSEVLTLVGDLSLHQAEVVQQLCHLLRHDDRPSIRPKAAEALGRLRASHPDVLAALQFGRNLPESEAGWRYTRRACQWALENLEAR